MAPGVTVAHVSAGPPAPIPKDDLLPHMDAFAEGLAQAWAARPPEAVHAHFWMSGRAALAAARALELPVLQTFHALGVVKRRHQGSRDTSPPERIPEESRIIGAVDRVLVTCSDELFEVIRLGGCRERISVIPCGVDLRAFRPQGPALARKRPCARVVIVSRLVERKGIGNAITALAQVPDCELLVAGGPPQRSLPGDPEYRRFGALALEAGVAERVRFLGALPRSRVPALLRSADVVACVPWYEPFGMVAVEAMACGVPVLASAVGGQVDTVVDGVTGLHVPPRRPDEIAKGLRTLLDRPSLRQAMGKMGAARARAYYGWDDVARATLAAYRRTLAQQTVPGAEAEA
jgi:glycosyltransferase involved in cell wall biosynthesis